MNSVPLIQNVDKDSINTTIIALKKAINEIESVLGLDSGSEIDTSVFVKKSEVVDAVEADNLNPVTSNAVADYVVDRIEVNNSQPVTSNAVANELNNYCKKFLTATISGTLTENGYLATNFNLRSKFIVSATCTDGNGFTAIPTNVNNNWWFYVVGTNNGYVLPRGGYVTVEYYYYDL